MDATGDWDFRTLFTFQYGSIQILHTHLVMHQELYLHSNMVLFKYSSVYKSYSSV